MKLFFEISIEGKITLESLKNSLSDEDSLSFDEEMIAIIKRFDKCNQGFITLKNFLERFNIDPRSNTFLPETTARLISFGNEEISKASPSNNDSSRPNLKIENTRPHYPFKPSSESQMSSKKALSEIFVQKQGNPLSRDNSPFSKNSSVSKYREISYENSESGTYYTPLNSSNNEKDKTPDKEKSNCIYSSLTSKRSSRRADVLRDRLRKYTPLLMVMIDCDRQLEKAKEVLALCPDFSVLDLYRELDQQANGKVTKIRFLFFLENVLNLNVRNEEIEIWFEKNLLSDNFYIYLGEFYKIFLARDEEFAKIMRDRKVFSPNNSKPIDEVFFFLFLSVSFEIYFAKP